MSAARILVVYFSRTGNTREVALEIARVLGADVEEIVDTVKRTGWLGYWRSGRDAWKEELTVLASPGRDVRPYDLVIVGTPVRRSSLSVPVRTYLAAHTGYFSHVAFFLTYGGMGRDRVFAQMSEACGLRPEAVVAVPDKEIERRDYVSRIARFADALTTAVGRPTRAAGIAL
jgi:flavodoxin